MAIDTVALGFPLCTDMFFDALVLLGAPALECLRTVYSRPRRGHGVSVDEGLGGTKTAAAAAASESLGFHLQPRRMPLDRKGHRVTPGTKRPNSVACFVFHLCIRTPSGIDTVLATCSALP